MSDLRKFCLGCMGKLERERAKVGIEFCKKVCAPGWPTDEAPEKND